MATEPAPLELVPLGRMTVELRAPVTLDGTPVGSRMIFEVESGTLVGDRVRGRVKGSANADWFVIGPDGTGTLDVRALIETDDGALIFVHYSGRTDVAGGGGSPIYAAPLFETGDERYRWLNTVQAVSKGALDGLTLTYDVFELR
jgi:hypothetical protein